MQNDYIEAFNDKNTSQKAQDEVKHEAQQCLIDGDRDCFFKKTNQARDIQIATQNAQKAQNKNAIDKVLNEQIAYEKGLKNQKSKKKEWEQRRKELNDTLTSKLSSQDQNTKLENGLQIQAMILDVLLEQYELQQMTSNMLATMYSTNMNLEAEKKMDEKEKPKEFKSDYDFTKKKDFETDAFGLPKLKTK